MKKILNKFNREGLGAHELGLAILMISAAAFLLLPFVQDATWYSRYFGLQKIGSEYFIASSIVGILLILAHYIFLGRKVPLIKRTHFVLYKHLNKLILCTISGGPGVVEYCVKLSHAERQKYHNEGERFILDLEKQIVSNPENFKSRMTKL